MNVYEDIGRFVDQPGLLVDLCRQALDRLVPPVKSDDVRETELQLREISKAIERLEAAQVSIPDALRGEKTRLFALIGITSEVSERVNRFCLEMELLVDDLHRRLGGSPLNEGSTRTRRQIPRRLTSRSVLREHIVIALRNLGGKATRSAVFREMERLLRDQLTPDDMAPIKGSRDNAWQNSARKEPPEMRRLGILCDDSPVGIWELREDHR